jgi:hypothetical protein
MSDAAALTFAPRQATATSLPYATPAVFGFGPNRFRPASPACTMKYSTINPMRGTPPSSPQPLGTHDRARGATDDAA